MKRLSVIAAVVVLAVWVGVWSGTSGGQTVRFGAQPGPNGGESTHFNFVIGFSQGDHRSKEAVNELLRQEQAHENSTRQLLKEFRAAESEEERAPILQKLALVVEDHFNVRQQIRERELEALEARIRKLRELHTKRENAKAEIVERRVEQLVRDAEGLGWSSGGNGPGAGAWNPLHAPHPPVAPGTPSPTLPDDPFRAPAAEPAVAR